mmetsp:Transcript_12230/g.40563  ORF Transcript_12230/g.40563 Transcript_12230/m.40563 type:complete len:220 (+) Transcript_12230:37-696(+)
MLSLLAASPSVVVSPVGASRLAVGPVRVGQPACLASDDFSLSRREVVAAAAGLSALLPAAQARAESTLVTRQQAYTRYVPRVERGRDYWAGGLRKQVSSGDWAAIQAALEKKGPIDRLFGPLELWSSSFSSKTISPKTLAMNDAIDELREACRDLRSAASGKEGSGGFFGFGGPKAMDDGKRRKIAQDAYAKGKDAINKYIELGNDGLGLNFTPIDQMD